MYKFNAGPERIHLWKGEDLKKNKGGQMLVNI